MIIVKDGLYTAGLLDIKTAGMEKVEFTLPEQFNTLEVMKGFFEQCKQTVANQALPAPYIVFTCAADTNDEDFEYYLERIASTVPRWFTSTQSKWQDGDFPHRDPKLDEATDIPAPLLDKLMLYMSTVTVFNAALKREGDEFEAVIVG